MITVRDETICRRLWENLNLGALSFGVTGSFEFRKFYSSLFEMLPYFICDNVDSPSYVLPLCEGNGRVDWFGTTELEDPPFYCRKEAGSQFLSSLRILPRGIEMINVNARQLKSLQECSLVKLSEVSGVKVIVEKGNQLIGKAHWSKRNLHRADKSFATLQPKWSFHENPAVSEVKSVFDDSIRMFFVRNRISKFNDNHRQKKYLSIFTSPIPGVKSVLGVCATNNLPAIKVLILLCGDVATIPIVALNLQHPESKVILQHGFRYAITSLPNTLYEVYGCRAIDYQGGNHSWKTEISPDSQLLQYKIKLWPSSI